MNTVQNANTRAAGYVLAAGLGALGGLYTALSVAKHPCAAVVACDLPFATEAFDWALAVHLFYFIGDWQGAARELQQTVTNAANEVATGVRNVAEYLAHERRGRHARARP